MRSRPTLTTFAALTAVVTLAACAGGDADADGDVSMTFWHNATMGAGVQYWEDTVAAFEEANPGVTIDIQSIQNEDLDGRLQTAVNSGDMPDIFMARGGSNLADMIEAGVVRDISDLIDDDVLADYGENVFNASTVDDAVYGMPVSVLPGGMFYSQDLFADAGIEATPATISELSGDVEALAATGVEPIALGAMDAWPAAHWWSFLALRLCSQETMETIATSLDFSDACWLEAGEALADFAETDPFNEGYLTTTAQQGAGSSAGLVANHEAAMELMGGWNVGVIASLTPDAQPLPDLGWFPFPAVDGGEGSPTAMLMGVDGYACSNDAPTACEDFLNFIAAPEQQEEYLDAFETIPASATAQSALEDPTLLRIAEAYGDADYAVVWLDTLLGQSVGNALNSAVVETLAGDGTPQSIVDAVVDAAER